MKNTRCNAHPTKVRYKSKKIATNKAKTFNENNLRYKDGKAQNPYFCNSCKGWHLTSKGLVNNKVRKAQLLERIETEAEYWISRLKQEEK